MRSLLFLIAFAGTAHAGGFFTDNPNQRAEFVVGFTCTECHDPLTSQKLPVAEGHLALSVFAGTPIADVSLGYQTHTPMPSTPLPGTLLTFGSGLAALLLGRWRLR